MTKTVALIGNPNCGKTTIFNALTGAHQYVGNWPGVTVERKSGFFEYNGQKIEVVDLPGVYSLSVISASSQDERIARDFLLYQKPDCVVNVLDAANLERNLYMTVQLFEMKLPVILVLNMMDAAAAAHVKVDVLALAHAFQAPVIPMVASRARGVNELKRQIAETTVQIHENFTISYPPEVEKVLSEMIPELQPLADKNGWSARWLAAHLLDGDNDAKLTPNPDFVRKYAARFDEDTDTLIADARYGLISGLAKKVIKREDRLSRSLSEKLDKIALGKYTGIPLFLVVMYLMFVWTITVGGLLIDPIDEFGETYLVGGFSNLLTYLHAPEGLNILLSQGVGRGISTVATFIPPIGFLFLFLSVLEDSGYMARGAFVMDKMLRSFNLPGTAFVPMIVAFGCTVPAVMGTRILSSMRDRLVTLTMTPFMSCGARLPVYALFATAFFAKSGSNIVFLLYLIGVVVAICTGLIMKRTLLKGDPVPLILEIPPYHLPILKNILRSTWDRLHGFIVRAGVLIVPLVIVLNVLNAVDIKGNAVPADESVLSSIGKAVTPAFRPLGITDENWPATVGLFTGVMAKEAVIGSLDALYAATGDGDTAGERLVEFFDGKIGAFAYLLFILMYVPCLSALGAIGKEFGAKWVGFTVLWTTGQAYALSTLFYQAATMNRHMTFSLCWIAGVIVAEIAVYALLRFLGNKGEQL